MGYLLQLVQALRYESQDDSQLARFLVNRAMQTQCLQTFSTGISSSSGRTQALLRGPRTHINSSKRHVDRWETKAKNFGIPFVGRVS